MAGRPIVAGVNFFMDKNAIIQLIQNAAAAVGISPAVAIAQARQESGLNPNAQSGAGAQGLWQFMPGTWAQYGQGSPFDPVAATDAWVRYMTKLLNQFGGRYDIALAGYNSGENRAEYRAAAADDRPINWAVMPAGIRTETQNYVRNILNAAGVPINFKAPAAIKRKATPATQAKPTQP